MKDTAVSESVSSTPGICGIHFGVSQLPESHQRGGGQFSGAFSQLFGLAFHKNRGEQWKQSFIHCYPEFYQHYTIF